MPHRDRRAALLIAWFALALVALWSPVATAQPTAPPAAVTPTSTATVPVTPTATVTPTRTAADLASVGWVDALPELFRNPWYDVLGLLALAGIVYLLSGYGEGFREAFKERGKRVAEGALRTAEAPAERKVAEVQRQSAEDAGLAAYLAWVQEECGVLPQKPLDEDDEELLLDQVYVPLRVVERDQMERFVAYRLRDFEADAEAQARAAAFEHLAQSQGVFRVLSDRDCLPPPTVSPDQRGRAAKAEAPAPEPVLAERLLLVGEAGSGKTTTLHFGALLLARDQQHANGIKARTELDLHTHERLLPVYIKLTLLMRYLLERYRADRSRLINPPADLVFEWLDTDLPRQASAIPAGLVVKQIQRGGCLILCDGLDETGDAAERDFAKALISNLVQACPKNRYIVASRPFEGVALGLSGFIERHLSPMDDKEMRRLLEQWFTAVGKSTRRRQRRSVSQELDELWGRLEASPRLFDMGMNPLLLTSMAILVHGGDSLPAERARVYHRLLNLTIVRWRAAEKRRGLPLDDPERVQRIYAEESDDDVRLRLQVVAAWMLTAQRREILLPEVRELLGPIYAANRKDWGPDQCRNYIRNLMQSLALHSGLIQERDERYSFIHFTLQEYLVARQYDEEGDIVGLLARRAEPRWRETILLAVGHWATSGYRRRAEDALKLLLAAGDSASLFLAAEALDEANAHKVVALGQSLADCQERLHALAFTPTACPDPVQRNQAASLLDRLGGDLNRPELDLTSAAYWAAQIAPGTFSMGDSNGKFDDEKPQFDCQITRPYALAHFPVTNRQYLVFVEALAGRGDDDQAKAAAQQLLTLMQQHKQESKDFRPRFWPGARYRAGEGNHPVVGVTWFAATAYAWWADAYLKARGVLQTGELVRLPTEAEWERAAAYPLTLAGSDTRAGRREYPWGNAWDLTDATGYSINSGIPANINESKIGGTSAVGSFPHGLAACGAEDLAGNVWEWCSTPPTSYPWQTEVSAETLYTGNKRASSTYVLRGGAWANDRVYARCAYRVDDDPHSDDGSHGFRLARLFSLS